MDDDSADDGEFANLALCLCSSAENIIVSEDELAHIQVSTKVGSSVLSFVCCEICVLHLC